jgi:hypothetical protein
VGVWTDRACLEYGLVVGTCECGNEPSGSIKCGEFHILWTLHTNIFCLIKTNKKSASCWSLLSKMRAISLQTENRLASQEGLCSMEKASKQASKLSCMMDLCSVFVERPLHLFVSLFVCLTLLRCDRIVCRSELSHITLYGTAVFGCIVF